MSASIGFYSLRSMVDLRVTMFEVTSRSGSMKYDSEAQVLALMLLLICSLEHVRNLVSFTVMLSPKENQKE
jgi:hypothetical protein